jgi:murein DD-endopeptidase MepM/ murein hydrolase activator NlpD
VGSQGGSTGHHLRYEVRIHDAPVNPHKYLRETL